MNIHHDGIARVSGGDDCCLHLCRHHIDLGKLFVSLIQTDARLEIVAPPRWGLICFRLRVSHVLHGSPTVGMQ